MTTRRIAVLGAGNGGHAMAAQKSLEGFQVSLFELPRFAEGLRRVLETKEITIQWNDRAETARIHQVTTDIAAALRQAEIVYVVTPAFGHRQMAQICAPHLASGQILCLMPGSGGSLEFAKVVKELGGKPRVLFCESSTLPYGARLTAPGQVRVLVEAVALPTGVFPSKETEAAIHKLQEVYRTTKAASNVLEAALNNPNPIVHPAATLLNAGRIEFSRGDFYLYKEGMTPSVARIYEAMERERFALLHALGLKYHHCAGLEPGEYNLGESVEECHDHILNTSMDAAFGPGSIEPGIQMKGPASMRDRFITEDVPYGLVFMGTLGRMLGVPTPMADAVVNLCGAIHRTDYWQAGRGIEKLGLAGMSLKGLETFLETGQ